MKNLGVIVTSSQKQKDGTHVKWFQFATVDEDGTEHGVSFYPPLHRKLMVTNKWPNNCIENEKCCFQKQSV